MKKEKFNIDITFLFIMIDSGVSQSSPDYFKILLDNKVLVKKSLPLFCDMDEFVDSTISEYFKIDPKWFIKKIANIEKHINQVNIIYNIKGQYLEHGNRMGRFINIKEFYDMDMGGIINDSTR